MTNQTIPSSRRPERETPAGEEAGNTPMFNRYGQSWDEVEDDRRRLFAEGTLSIRALDDTLGVFHTEGRPINRDDLDRFRRQLFDIYETLGQATDFGMGDSSDDDNDLYCDHYSDGTPQTIVSGAPHGSDWSGPLDPRRSGVPWLPKMSGPLGYLPDGASPPGCELLVAVQPYQRQPRTQISHEKPRAWFIQPDQQHG